MMTSMDDDADNDLIEVSSNKPTARMIDWLQSWKVPMFCGGTVALAGMFLFYGKAEAVYSILFLGILVGVWTLSVQLRGLYFDRSSGKLSYPLFCFRRSLALDAIEDANCQIKNGNDDPFSFLVGLIGLRSSDTYESKRYIVNLSGTFGARRVIFHSKYKRDQFLSLLRSFAPQVRITRWS